MLRGFGPAYSAPLLAALDTAPSVSVRANTLKGLQAKDKADPVPRVRVGFYLPTAHCSPPTRRGTKDFTMCRMRRRWCTTLLCALLWLATLPTPPRSATSTPARLPGGKSIAALEALPSDALLVANEYDGHRANILLENLTKAGAQCGREPRRRLRLPSAPRSLRHHRRRRALLGRGDDAQRRAESRGPVVALADRAMRRHPAPYSGEPVGSPAPGGVLIYSTCTFNRTENELMVSHIADTFGAKKYRTGSRPLCVGVF